MTKRLWTDESTPTHAYRDDPYVAKAEGLIEEAFRTMLDAGYHNVETEHYLQACLNNYAASKRLMNGLKLHREGKLER